MSKKSLDDASAPERAEYARRIKTLRQGQKLKQSELAERAGVTRQTISNMENGVTPQRDVLRRVLEVLGVDLDAPQFQEETTLWLTMIGTLIETIPQEERPPVVDAAIRVLSDGVRRSARTAKVTALPVGGDEQNSDLFTTELNSEKIAAAEHTEPPSQDRDSAQ